MSQAKGHHGSHGSTSTDDADDTPIATTADDDDAMSQAKGHHGSHGSTSTDDDGAVATAADDDDDAATAAATDDAPADDAASQARGHHGSHGDLDDDDAAAFSANATLANATARVVAANATLADVNATSVAARANATAASDDDGFEFDDVVSEGGPLGHGFSTDDDAPLDSHGDVPGPSSKPTTAKPTATLAPTAGAVGAAPPAAARDYSFCAEDAATWRTARGAFAYNATSAGRTCLLRSASDDASSILVKRNASLGDARVAASFAQHAYAEHGLLQLLWRLGAVADTDTLEGQDGYSCLWSSALDAGSSEAAATVHLRAGERVLHPNFTHKNI